MKKTFTQNLRYSEMDIEDGGQYKGFHIEDDEENDNGLYIKLGSWDENLAHEDLTKLIGKTVRITLEIIN